MPRAEERMLRTYTEVVSYLHQIYTTDDVNAETDAALTSYIQPLTISPAQCVEALVTKMLR